MKNKLKLIITKSAQDDIRGIVSYIALDNKTAALKFAKVIKMVYLCSNKNLIRPYGTENKETEKD